MSQPRILQRLAVVLPAALASACAIGVGADERVVREEKRFQMSGVPELVLETFDGSIRVEAWDRPEVLVQIERRAATEEGAQQLEVRTTQEGNRLTVQTSQRGMSEVALFTFGRSASVSYIVSAPRDARVQARTGDGSVSAVGIAGSLHIETGDGSITAERVAGDLRLRTGDGAVRIVDSEGRLEVDTGDGSLWIAGRFNEVRAHTGDGSVHLEVAAETKLAADWQIDTGDGSINVRLPDSFDAQVEANSGDGRISVRGENVAITSSDDERRKVSATIGKGGRALRLTSGDGSMTITQGGAENSTR